MYSSGRYRSKDSLPREEAALADFLSRHTYYTQSAQVDFLRAREFSHLDDEHSLRLANDGAASRGRGGDVVVKCGHVAAQGVGAVAVIGGDGRGGGGGPRGGDVAAKDGDAVAVQGGGSVLIGGGYVAVERGDDMAGTAVRWGDNIAVVRGGGMAVERGDVADTVVGDMAVKWGDTADMVVGWGGSAARVGNGVGVQGGSVGFNGGDMAVRGGGMAVKQGDVADTAVGLGDMVAQEGNGVGVRGSDVGFNGGDMAVRGGSMAVEWGNMADTVVGWGDMAVREGGVGFDGGDMAVQWGDMVVKEDNVVVKKGDAAVKDGEILVKGQRVCLDYAGAGLFSHWQHRIGMAGCELSLAYISVNLATQVLFPSGVGAEAAIRRRIFECLRIHDRDYCLAFTADAPSAWRLLGESYPFHSLPNLLTAFDHGYEPVDQLHTRAHAHTHMRASRALLLWPGLGFDSDNLRKRLRPLPQRRTDNGNGGLSGGPFRGLFAYPLVSRLTGRRHSRKWISEARENSWHVLLDLSGLGSESLPSLELSTHLPDFIVCSFYKVFGFDPSGFGCLIIRRSALGILGDSLRARAVGMVRIISRRDKERIRSSHVRSSSFSSESIRFSNDPLSCSPPPHGHESMISFASELVPSSNDPHSHPHGHESATSLSFESVPFSNLPPHGRESRNSFTSELIPSSSNNPHSPPHGRELSTFFSSESILSSSNNPHLPPHGPELTTSFSFESVPPSNNPHSPPSGRESMMSFSFNSIPFSNNPHLPPLHGRETTSLSSELIPSSNNPHSSPNSHESTTPSRSSSSSQDFPSPRVPLYNDLSHMRQNSPSVISHSRIASESNTREENQHSPSTIDACTAEQVEITVLDDSTQDSAKKSNGKQPVAFEEGQSSASRKSRSKGVFFWDSKSTDSLLRRREIGITIGNMVDSSQASHSVPTQIINNSSVERKGKNPRSVKQGIPDVTKSTIVAPEEGSKTIKVGGGGVKGLFYGKTLSPRPLPNLEEASVRELGSSPKNSVGYRARLQSSSFRIVGADRSEEENSGLVFCRGLDLSDQIDVKILRYRQRCLVSWLITSLRSLSHGHQHLVVIYGSLHPSHYGSVIAFNLLDSHGRYLNPSFVQKLADRSNISLGSGFIEGTFVMEPKERNRESPVACVELPPQMCCSKGGEVHKMKLPVLNVTLGFLSNFSDVYRLWVFVAQFLDSTLYNQDLWHYRKLNQETVVI